MTTTIELKKIRKVCTNCKMNAMHTNESFDLSSYGSVTLTKNLHCENCGHSSK